MSSQVLVSLTANLPLLRCSAPLYKTRGSRRDPGGCSCAVCLQAVGSGCLAGLAVQNGVKNCKTGRKTARGNHFGKGHLVQRGEGQPGKVKHFVVG